ncbi:MAG: ABC transporter permease [Actinomycetota bacterium]|nr:ABC transporter permease [Actinomycetota bacterium]
MSAPDVQDHREAGSFRDRLTTPSRSRSVAVGAVAFAVGYPLLGLALPDGAPFGVVLQGAVFGTVTALLAMGLILLYRTDSIINFSYGAMGLVGGNLGVNLYLEAGWNYLFAMAVGVGAGLAVGAIVELTVIRRFKDASRLTLTVATIGLAQILGYVGAIFIPGRFGSTGLVGGFETPYTFGFDVGPVRFTAGHVVIMVAVPPIIAALSWFLLRTDAGVAVRSAAQNKERAQLLGIPIDRLKTIVWIVAGGLAALTIVLQAPFAGTASNPLTAPITVLLPALAAAVIARMESLPLAFFAGIGLGVLEQLVRWNVDKASASDLAFLVVILGALLLQSGKLSRAHDVSFGLELAGVVRAVPAELSALPEVRWVRRGMVAVVLLAAVLVPRGWAPSSQSLATTAVVWCLVAVSLVVLSGWAGKVSLGQFGVVGVAAIVAGNIVQRWNIDIFVTVLIAGLAGAAAALIIGVPALRIKGLFLAVTTLAFAVTLDSFLLNPVNFPDQVPDNVNPPIFWDRFDGSEQLVLYNFALGLLIVSLLLTNALRRTRWGRVFQATKDNEKTAQAQSVPTTKIKLVSFCYSGFIAGLAGGVYVLVLRGARVNSFPPIMSLEVFSMTVIGGLGSLLGAVSGVVLFRFLQNSELLGGDLRLAVTGAGLLIVLYIYPGGLGQAMYAVRDRYLRMIARRRRIHVPSLIEDSRQDDAVTSDGNVDEPPDPPSVPWAHPVDDTSVQPVPTTSGRNP